MTSELKESNVGHNLRSFSLMLTLIIAVVFVAFGFNTIDAMIWNFYHHPWIQFAPYQWAFTPTLKVDVWFAYFLGGIMPLAIGFFLIGFLCAWLILRTAKE